MTPTQWLAIPTEIKLSQYPKLVSSPPKNTIDMPDVNGSGITIKEEEESDDASSGDGQTQPNPRVLLLPVGSGIFATSSEVPGTGVPLECVSTVNETSTVNGPDLVIVSSKPRNPDYKVDKNMLATKRNRPVTFRIERGRPGVIIYISLAYQGHIYADVPVLRCKVHDECTWCKEHEFNQSFCIISKFHKFELDHKGQPTAVIILSAEHLDKNGQAEFSMVFSCWNSCDKHARYGKDLCLVMHIFDGQMRKIEYNLHCCQNLLRDGFKDKKRDGHVISSGKRKLFNDTDGRFQVPKSVCPPSKEPESSPTSPTLPDHDRDFDLVVEGLDEERRDIIERMVKVMGGHSYRIPHLNRVTTYTTLRNPGESGSGESRPAPITTTTKTWEGESNSAETSRIHSFKKVRESKHHDSVKKVRDSESSSSEEMGLTNYIAVKMVRQRDTKGEHGHNNMSSSHKDTESVRASEGSVIQRPIITTIAALPKLTRHLVAASPSPRIIAVHTGRGVTKP